MQGQSLIVGRYITPIYLSYPPYQFQSLCCYFSHRSLLLPRAQKQSVLFQLDPYSLIFSSTLWRAALSVSGYYHRFQVNIDCIPTGAMLKVSRYAQSKNRSSTIVSPCCSFPNLTLIYKDDTGRPFVTWFFTLIATSHLLSKAPHVTKKS